MSQTPQSTTTRMSQQLESWAVNSDRRGIFLDCYSRMTRNMLAAIHQGRFEDSEWVSGLLNHFADYYFVALDGFERADKTIPPVWTHTHKAALAPGTTALQNLLLGVNAHINYDLVFALVDVLESEWADASDAAREMRYRDHCLVNTIIGETIDEVQDEVVERYSPGMDIFDKIGGPVDEWVTSWLIARWREDVWVSAVNMLGCTSEGDRQAIRDRVEANAVERAHLLLLV